MKQPPAIGLRLGALMGTVSTVFLVVLSGVRIIGVGQVGVPAAWGEAAAVGGSEGRGQTLSPEDDLSSQVKACQRAALGANIFDELIVEARRQPDLVERAMIDFCRSVTQGPSDMPVYDLRVVFNPLLYPPNYPNTVVGTGGQSWFALMDLLDDDVEVARLRRAGINTIAFTVLYELGQWGVPTIARAKEAANLVIRARIRGFAVYLKLDTFSVEVPCQGSYAENLAAWHDHERRAAVALTRFAQELNVEYISPNNESEGALQSGCLDPIYSQDSGREPYQQMLDPAGEPGLTARVAVISAWHVAVLAELRTIFHGRVVAHFGTVHPEIYVPGHDGLAFTLDHAHLSAAAFRTHVRATYLSADSAAHKSGDLQWVASAYFPFSLAGEFTDADHPDYDPAYEPNLVEDARMRGMQGTYAAISIEESVQFQDQSRYGGYLSQGWVDTGIEIRGSKSEFVLYAHFGGVFPQDLSMVQAKAAQGLAEMQAVLGLMYDLGVRVPQDDAEAMRWYRLAAEQGYADAQNNLGVMYATGRGVPQDDAEAVRWYRLAAEKEHAGAQCNLGVAYATGRGVPQDDTEAVRWWLLAAEHGEGLAESYLAFMYANGRGVPPDNVTAYMWSTLATRLLPEGNRERVIQFRNALEERLTPSQRVEAQRLAREWDAAHPREP